jgi:hypothetical protein
MPTEAKTVSARKAITRGARALHAGEVSLLVAVLRIRGFSLHDAAP